MLLQINYPKDEDNTPHVLSIIKKGKTIINLTANHIENIVKYVIKRVFGPWLNRNSETF